MRPGSAWGKTAQRDFPVIDCHAHLGLANIGQMGTLADEDIRASWREDKGLTVFSLWSPSYPGTEVDLFVEEPFDFGEAWSRRLDALLDDGTTVHVVGIDDLRALKASVGRPKDVDDIAQLDAIARATLEDDEDGE